MSMNYPDPTWVSFVDLQKKRVSDLHPGTSRTYCVGACRPVFRGLQIGRVRGIYVATQILYTTQQIVDTSMGMSDFGYIHTNSDFVHLHITGYN